MLVATHAYTHPLIAVLLRAFIAGEHVTPRIIAAAAGVILSILLVRHHELKPRTEDQGSLTRLSADVR